MLLPNEDLLLEIVFFAHRLDQFDPGSHSLCQILVGDFGHFETDMDSLVKSRVQSRSSMASGALICTL